jgi:Putative zinc-finger
VTHPHDLLAAYVDASLEATERAHVEEHLRSCERCRREVAAALAARGALRSLPVPDAPDIASRFTPERVATIARPARAEADPWRRVVPALAAAAIVVGLIALAAPRLTTSDGRGPSAEGAAETAADAGGGVRLELSGRDYDEAAIEDAAAAFASSVGAGDAAAGTPQELAGAPEETSRLAGPGLSARAVACLEEAFPGHPGRLVRAERARFHGRPAYLGYVLEDGDAGRPANTVSIWVAAVEDCSILSLTSARV